VVPEGLCPEGLPKGHRPEGATRVGRRGRSDVSEAGPGGESSTPGRSGPFPLPNRPVRRGACSSVGGYRRQGSVLVATAGKAGPGSGDPAPTVRGAPRVASPVEVPLGSEPGDPRKPMRESNPSWACKGLGAQ